MKKRREIAKILAKENFKNHPVILIAMCLLSGIFSGSFLLSFAFGRRFFWLLLLANSQTSVFSDFYGFLAEVSKEIRAFDFSGAMIKGAGPFLSAGITEWFFFVLRVIFIATVFFFLWNPYRATKARMVLEGNTYRRIPMSRYLYLVRVRGYGNAVKTMARKTGLQLLWNLTVVGGMIKYYSYRFVPYLIAENPRIRSGEAISLSEKMMKGHKAEAFLFDLSFLLWKAGSLLTFGLLGFFFSRPYQSCARASFFVSVREEYLKNHPETAVLLNDRYLYQSAEESLLSEKYPEIPETEKKIADRKKNAGLRGIMEQAFGITVSYDCPEKERQKAVTDQARQRSEQFEKTAKTYPERLSPLPEAEKTDYSETAYFTRYYSVLSVVLLFVLGSAVGFLLEIFFCRFLTLDFISVGEAYTRNYLFYGIVMLIVMFILTNIKKRPFFTFLAWLIVFGLCYFLFGTRTGNIGIFLEMAVYFSALGLSVTYVFAPLLDNRIRKLLSKDRKKSGGCDEQL